MSDAIKSTVSTFLIDNFRFGDTSVAIADDESLIETGFIDSTGVLEIIAFLEQTHGVTVADSDIENAVLPPGSCCRISSAPVA